jgi:hypothetical protein
MLVPASLQGALPLARIHRTTTPVRLAGEHIAGLLENELGVDPASTTSHETDLGERSDDADL